MGEGSGPHLVDVDGELGPGDTRQNGAQGDDAGSRGRSRRSYRSRGHREGKQPLDRRSRFDQRVGTEFASHGRVEHSAKEYGRAVEVADETIKINTNTVKGYYSIFKRGIKGVYQHCAEHHLHRYLAEFDFRYSNRSAMGIEDGVRALIALKVAKGKRLTYRKAN